MRFVGLDLAVLEIKRVLFLLGVEAGLGGFLGGVIVVVRFRHIGEISVVLGLYVGIVGRVFFAGGGVVPGLGGAGAGRVFGE